MNSEHSLPESVIQVVDARYLMTRNERLTDAASSTQQSELVFHNSVPAE